MLEGLSIIAIIITLIVLAAIGGTAWFIYMKIRFRTVPSNEALIVTGPKLGDEEKEKNIYKDDQGRYMKVIRGGGHRLRMFQTGTKVSLKSFQLQIKTPKVYTAQHVGVYGEAVATVKVADTLEGIVRYAEQFLGKAQGEIEQEIGEVLNSSLRAILSSMTVEQINGDRERFNEDVRKIAQKELNDMGFRITSLGLTDISDDDGYLENLGRPQIAEIEKQAEIAEANNKRETELKQAEVNEEVSREKYQREMNIAEVRKTKDIKDAQIKAETERERAIAEAAYELEKEEKRLGIEKQRLEIKEQEQESELRLRQKERENDVKLEQQQVEVQKQKAEAEYLTKTKEAQARAEARRVEGEAEAAVIRQKSIAEIEAIEKRAQAMAKHQDVILREKLIDIMPDYARAISQSFSNVESIRILDNGSGGGINSLPNTVTNTMANLQESLGQMTGFDLEGFLQKISMPKSNDDADNAKSNQQQITLKDSVKQIENEETKLTFE
ncbi:flotillin family protein [Terribacillus saccharophilus]|uniref:flotillin family protein n=1 Tax=Terribacillus saccharophilus TaxID=361277 RepID=UPI00398198D0